MAGTYVAGLPVYHTSMIGRSAEQADVTRLICESSGRLVTLVGESGAGKTRLALAVAGAMEQEFPDGIIFVPLDAVQDVRFVLPAIAAAAGITESPHEPLLATLVTALGNKSMLLILDNIEQVAGAASELGALVRSTQNLRVFVTSQIALMLPEEDVYHLPPLSIPPTTIRPTPESFLRYPAIALFVNRLQAVQPHFHLTTANAPDVRRICQLLDGFPLAIELVAAHSETLQPSDLLLLLRNYLAGGIRREDSRRDSRTAILGPVLGWCSSRLPDAARRVLETLGVFAGGWTQDSGHAILLPEMDQETAIVAFTILVRKHLVQQTIEPDQTLRYRVLDTIRAYSETLLDQTGQRRALQEGHLAYYLRLAETASSAAQQGDQQVLWIKRLLAAHYNLRTALSWARNVPHPDVFVRLVTALSWFWRTTMSMGENGYWMEQALQYDQIAPKLQGPLWYEAGKLEMKQDHTEKALGYFQRALARFQTQGDKPFMAETALVLGTTYGRMGDPQTAMMFYEEAAGIWEGLQNRKAKAWPIQCLGYLHVRLGNWEQSMMLSEEARLLFMESGDQYGVGSTTLNIGWVLYGQQDYRAALVSFREALAIFHAMNALYPLAEVLEGLAGVYGHLNQSEHGVTILGAAATLRETMNAPIAQIEKARYYTIILNQLRAQLSERAFAEAWERGQAFPLAPLIAMTMVHPVEGSFLRTTRKIAGPDR